MLLVTDPTSQRTVVVVYISLELVDMALANDVPAWHKYRKSQKLMTLIAVERSFEFVNFEHFLFFLNF